MELKEAVDYFGSGYKMCQSLGLNRQNYTLWKKNGSIPYVQQIRIQNISEGLLKADFWRFNK